MKTLISKILGVPKTLWAFVWPLVTKQVGLSLTTLLPIALQIVKDLAQENNIANSEKRQQAFEKLSDAAKNEGMNAGSSLLNLAIEMAVMNLKATSKD